MYKTIREPSAKDSGSFWHSGERNGERPFPGVGRSPSRDAAAMRAISTPLRDSSPVGERHDYGSYRRLESLENADIVLSAGMRSRKGYETTKRALDVVLSAAALIVLSPALAVIALLVWLEDGGPIFYTQMRVGRSGRHFSFYKFRSMVVGADCRKAELDARNEATGPIFKMRRDPRVTRIGRVLRRYSLDELPQFLNVLRGDMSLVGPRPHLPSEIERCPDYPQERLSVPPGLCCLREVQGRSLLSFERWLELDLRYVQRRSFLLDLWILAHALPAVLRGEGAF